MSSAVDTRHIDSDAIRIASCQYPVEFMRSWSRFEEKIVRYVQEAVEGGSRILVFPEYAGMELASLFPESIYSHLSRQLEAIQDYLPPFLDLHRRLARHNRVYILAGTFPVRLEDGTFRNRAYFFAPDGNFDFQEKIVMTRFEREEWGITGGDQIRVFETSFGSVGINICYDIEFPLIARATAVAGAAMILAPSCTDTPAGYHRVRIAGRARALENQCYVVHSSTVGEALWSPAVDVNVGAAAIYSPVDFGFPDDGVLACGDLNAPGWIHADAQPALIDRVRSDGQVLNYKHWEEQNNILSVSRVTL